MDQVKAMPDERGDMYAMRHAVGEGSPELMNSADKFGY